MRHRLALVAQALWAVVDGVASVRTTHGCQEWLSWAPALGATMLDGILRGLANPETRWREAKPREQE